MQRKNRLTFAFYIRRLDDKHIEINGKTFSIDEAPALATLRYFLGDTKALVVPFLTKVGRFIRGGRNESKITLKDKLRCPVLVKRQ